MRFVVRELPTPVPRLADRALVDTLTPADAYRLSLAATYDHTKYARATRYGAFAALAAGAGAGYRAAGRMERGVHWKPGGRSILIVPEGVPRPVAILPFVEQAVETMLETRKDDEPWLFLNEEGQPMRFGANSFCCGLHALGGRIAVGGTGMFRGLLRTFEDAVEIEQDDLEAVAVMTGNRELLDDFDPLHQTVSDLRLMRVLRRCHPLSCPLERYDADWLAAVPFHLPPTPELRRRPIPSNMNEDPGIARMLAEEWPLDDQTAAEFGRDFAERHFPHLDDLRRAEKIRRREIMYLLRIDNRRYKYLVGRRNLQLEGVPPVSLPRGGWREIVPAVYRDEGFAGRPLAGFQKHLRKHHGCRLWPLTIRKILENAGELKRRRGRPRKRRQKQ